MNDEKKRLLKRRKEAMERGKQTMEQLRRRFGTPIPEEDRAWVRHGKGVYEEGHPYADADVKTPNEREREKLENDQKGGNSRE